MTLRMDADGRLYGLLARWDEQAPADEPAADPFRCGCGDQDPAGCLYVRCGYLWCRPCEEHHRAPECPVDEQGRALAPCGHPWDDALADDHDHDCDTESAEVGA